MRNQGLQNDILFNTYYQPLNQIIEDSKFLRIDSLLELIKALINVHMESEEDDDIEVFKLEILLQIVLLNRDRVSSFWSQLSNYFLRLLHLSLSNEALAERVTSAIFRLAIRFIPRPDSLNDQVYLLLNHMLTTFGPNLIQRHCTALALHSFISHCHSYVVRPEDWSLVFDYLLFIGIGFRRRKPAETQSIQSDPEDNISNAEKTSRGYTSDPETITQSKPAHAHNPYQLTSGSSTEPSAANGYKILDLVAYEKCTETLTLIIREILPKNVQQLNESEALTITQFSVDVLRKYVEASVKIQMSSGKSGQLRRAQSQKFSEFRKSHHKSRQANKSRLTRIANAILSSSESEDDEESEKPTDVQPKLSSVTEACALKLLDLMHFMHLNATLATQSAATASEYLWSYLWCPLLQGKNQTFSVMK